MKKVIVSMMLLAAITCGAFAQKANVSKAKSKAQQDNPDFKTAEEAIKAALQDPTTKDDAETWYTAGFVFEKKSSKEYANQIINQKFDQDVLGSSLVTAYGYYIKAYDLDQLPNEKGKVKPRFSKDIKNTLKTYYTDGQLIRYGSYLFDQKKYTDVVKAFDVYISIPDQKMFAPGELKKDSTYKMVKYYAAIADINANDTIGSIKRLESLKNDNYETKNVYELLYQQYYAIKDTAKYVAVLMEGSNKFPAEPFFIQNIINHYIYSGKTKEALDYLNQAIEKEPTIAQYYYVKGNLLEINNDVPGAKAAFEKALELKANFADAEAGLGRLYYNQAVNMLSVANDIKDATEYNKKVNEATVVFKQSLPYFEKARQMNPNDQDIKATLKKLYYRLQMDKEYQDLDKE
jgi:tetratricopeptide (TPR) repeat protein